MSSTVSASSTSSSSSSSGGGTGGSVSGSGGTSSSALIPARPRSITGNNSAADALLRGIPPPPHQQPPQQQQQQPQQQPPLSSQSHPHYNVAGTGSLQSSAGQPLQSMPPPPSSSSAPAAASSSHQPHHHPHHHHPSYHYPQPHHHAPQHPAPHRLYNNNSKPPFFTNNPSHNSNAHHHHPHYGGSGHSNAASCQHPSAGDMGAPPTGASLGHKAGPAYFNISRQRYTPYYSRSYSNSSNGSGGAGGGGANSDALCGRYGLPSMHHNAMAQPHAPQMHQLMSGQQQSAAAGLLLNTTGDSGFTHTSSSDAGNSSGDHTASTANSNVSLNCSSSGVSSQNSSLCAQLTALPAPPLLLLSASSTSLSSSSTSSSAASASSSSGGGGGGGGPAPDNSVTLQISNIDTSIEDRALKHYLLGKLKPLTPIMSFAYEGLSMVKIRVPSQHHAKQVVSYLHRKKIGHKRITVSYTRDSSTMEPSTLRCQVAGLLKDIPFYKLSMYKFRELFQSRFKTSISVMDLYDMKDICTITENASDEKCISLRPELINSIENSELLGCLQLSVPYCTAHFKSGHRGWAELEIEPLPNVWMTVTSVRQIVYDLLKRHKGDIPIASLVYCVEAELGAQIERNESGVNLEHLISCVNGVHITTNKFGIKILSWLAASSVLVNGKATATAASGGGGGGGLMGYATDDGQLASHQAHGQPPHAQHMMMMGSRYTKFANVADPFGQISREIVELVKMSPKATMKFSRFIPAYHNHFGKQCRVADYGYTKLIELFEALHGIVQIMGDGENRQITLTHKCQIRCFTTDILRLLRTQPAKAMPMAHLEALFTTGQSRKFEITDYGVCDMEDIMESLVRNNVVCLERSGGGGEDMCMVAIPKRRQTRLEVQKTCTFAGEVVELLRNSSQYAIPFEKFACSYHYNYGYQCRLSDYGFLKLTDLMEAITGVVEIEVCNDEDRRVALSPKVAQRVFGEQLRDLTRMLTASSCTPMNLSTLLFYHKKQFGYQMQPQSLGIGTMWYAIKDLPYVELTGTTANDDYIVVCHHEDAKFVYNGYAACRVILESGKWAMPLANFIDAFFAQFGQIVDEHAIDAMNHAVEMFIEYGAKYVRISPLMVFVLRIISVLEMMNVVSVNDLKAILNIGISDCFPYGYPNFAALIQAFADVFLCSSTVVNDMSEIMLNKQCLLAKNGVQEGIRGGVANYGGGAAPTMGDQQQQQQQQQQPHPPHHGLMQPPFQSRQSVCGSGRLFQPPTPVSVPPPPLAMPMVGRFDATWSGGDGGCTAERAFSGKYTTVNSAPPGLPCNVSASLVQQQHAHRLQMLGSGSGGGGGGGDVDGGQQMSATSSARSSPTSTTGDEVSVDVSDDSMGAAKRQSPGAVAKSKATAEKENFYFNIMQSADFDISVIENLFFKTSSPAEAASTSTDQLAADATDLSLASADSAEPPADADAKRVPLYERKPSAEWLLSHPSPPPLSSTAKASAASSGDLSSSSASSISTTPPTAGQSVGSLLFDPPKPDTPPSNVPFWMDPVWRHESPSSVSATTTPLVESLNIAIPELKTFDGLPALDTPTAMHDLLEHNASMFTFDF